MCVCLFVWLVVLCCIVLVCVSVWLVGCVCACAVGCVCLWLFSGGLFVWLCRAGVRLCVC